MLAVWIGDLLVRPPYLEGSLNLDPLRMHHAWQLPGFSARSGNQVLSVAACPSTPCVLAATREASGTPDFPTLLGPICSINAGHFGERFFPLRGEKNDEDGVGQLSLKARPSLAWWICRRSINLSECLCGLMFHFTKQAD